MKRLAKELICIMHRYRQQCGEGWGRGWDGWTWAKVGGGEWKTSVIGSTIFLNNKNGSKKYLHVLKRKKSSEKKRQKHSKI